MLHRRIRCAHLGIEATFLKRGREYVFRLMFMETAIISILFLIVAAVSVNVCLYLLLPSAAVRHLSDLSDLS